jgi:diadenosine tetraphosphate (Ap4A) HIT family hydrolase
MAESSPFRHVSKSEHGPLIPARLPDCIICRQNDQSDSAYPVDIIAQNRLWLIHHMYCGPPAGSPPSAAWGNPGAQTGGDSDLPGHLLLHSQRHVHGPADFTDEEAGNFVFAVRHVERLLLEITQAERIYTVLIGETGPHLHAHLIPRYSDTQLAEMGVSVELGGAMGVFDLYRAVQAGSHPAADAAHVARVVAQLKARLAEEPLPMRGGASL